MASQQGTFQFSERRVSRAMGEPYSTQRYVGWKVNRKRVEQLWRREGLKVPAKQPKRGRLWLNDGS